MTLQQLELKPVSSNGDLLLKLVPHYETELGGRISYFLLRKLMELYNDREFHIRKTSREKFILRVGGHSSVARARQGKHFLHFHPKGSCGDEFEGLPSANDILLMIKENHPHCVISRYGISTYLKSSSYYPRAKSRRHLEDLEYKDFRSRVKNMPLQTRWFKSEINYAPWEYAELQEHDFRIVPTLNVNLLRGSRI